MKKRIVLFSFVMALMMLFTACGTPKTLDGKWVGKIDVTKQFEDGIKAASPEIEKYVDFEDLVVTLDVTFDGEEMAMVVNPESIITFNVKFAEGMKKIAVAYWAEGLSAMDFNLEEAITESGMTEDAYMRRIYQETGVDKMIESMSAITETTLDRISLLKGPYTTPVANELRLYYAEDKYESMEYKFVGNKLNITIKGDGFSLLVECEKSK